MGGIRINAITKYLTLTTAPLNHNQPYTWMTKFETTTSNDKKCNLMVIDRGTFTDMDRARPFWFQSPLDIEVSGVLASGTINLVIGIQWWIILRRKTPTLLEGLVNGVVDVTNTTDVSARSAPTRMSMGALPEGSEGTDNSILYPSKAWQAALSDGEIFQEMRSIIPVRRANLYGFWPMMPGTGNRGRDWSGGGHHFTEVGSPTDAAGPGIAWEIQRFFVGFDAGSSFNPTQTVTDSASGADAASAVRAATVAETASGADATSGVRASTIAEAGSGADADNGVFANTTADTGSGADAIASQSQPTTAETAAASDAASAAGASTLAETGSGADALTAQTQPAIAEAASGSDASTAASSGSSAETGTDGDQIHARQRHGHITILPSRPSQQLSDVARGYRRAFDLRRSTQRREGMMADYNACGA
jgi:hypothetical protein